MENSVHWDVKICRLLETYQRLDGTFYPKDGGNRFSWKVANFYQMWGSRIPGERIVNERTSEHKNRKNKEKERTTRGNGKIKNIEMSRITKSNFHLRNPIRTIYLCTSDSHLKSLESKETCLCSSLKIARGFACGSRTGRLNVAVTKAHLWTRSVDILITKDRSYEILKYLSNQDSQNTFLLRTGSITRGLLNFRKMSIVWFYLIPGWETK